MKPKKKDRNSKEKRTDKTLSQVGDGKSVAVSLAYNWGGIKTEELSEFSGTCDTNGSAISGFEFGTILND